MSFPPRECVVTIRLTVAICFHATLRPSRDITSFCSGALSLPRRQGRKGHANGESQGWFSALNLARRLPCTAPNIRLHPDSHCAEPNARRHEPPPKRGRSRSSRTANGRRSRARRWLGCVALIGGQRFAFTRPALLIIQDLTLFPPPDNTD